MQARDDIDSIVPEALQLKSFAVCTGSSARTRMEAAQHVLHCSFCAGWIDGYMRAQFALESKEPYSDKTLKEWRDGGCDADTWL
jgi:hypothetical protein